ncbi:hypothetical protein [Paenibacillus lutrae]|uniref:hypothetical protein n=1 Tax=Paenibacillus lutrae TaxID=2078573 RepID=UPI0012F8232C|nr:hypothetical protein [Paenibacillus lutrae]
MLEPQASNLKHASRKHASSKYASTQARKHASTQARKPSRHERQFIMRVTNQHQAGIKQIPSRCGTWDGQP